MFKALRFCTPVVVGVQPNQMLVPAPGRAKLRQASAGKILARKRHSQRSGMLIRSQTVELLRYAGIIFARQPTRHHERQDQRLPDRC
jgi:hypothetical protein